jgi:hypothetical protein
MCVAGGLTAALGQRYLDLIGNMCGTDHPNAGQRAAAKPSMCATPLGLDDVSFSAGRSPVDSSWRVFLRRRKRV